MSEVVPGGREAASHSTVCVRFEAFVEPVEG